ncbi:Tctex-1 family-domain-containing protein [Exophiala viscosa]|uniref:Tctex-1 family-domain-containing protein n=1 Tax=Exophiala viscosa TaxID=2486360 RepID=A0AAN6E398_9EURO|nr:Tctex-1 family-domain-containing protein [Exophiala viscosa]
MSTLLRKVKSTIGQATDSRWDETINRPTTRNRLHRAQHRASERPSQNSIVTVNQVQPEHPLNEFRRRLARKASTFSLRAKRWRAEYHTQDQEEAVKQEDKEDEETFASSRETVVGIRNETVNTTPQAEGRTTTDRDTQTISSETILKPETDEDTVEDTAEDFSLPFAYTKSSVSRDPVLEHIREQQEKYLCKDEADGKTCVKMASEQAAPPVPYTRLKEITENACEAALSGVTSYSHPDTESWNTTIINSILGALVDETGKLAGGAPTQPQFKYVVNSTIIQHASSSSDDAKKAKGRRGMHAASGAYWNNEKDGMWSYKYPGAESKGLDVVIGIIWIWVG